MKHPHLVISNCRVPSSQTTLVGSSLLPTNGTLPHQPFTMMLRLLLIIALATSLTAAFNANAHPRRSAAKSTGADADAPSTRRDILKQTTTSLGILTLLSTTTKPAPTNAAVIRAPGKCANGEGDGCDSLAEDNEFIKSLQKQSSDNREANQRVGTIFGMKPIGWAALAVILNDLTSYILEQRQQQNDTTDDTS